MYIVSVNSNSTMVVSETTTGINEAAAALQPLEQRDGEFERRWPHIFMRRGLARKATELIFLS